MLCGDGGEEGGNLVEPVCGKGRTEVVGDETRSRWREVNGELLVRCGLWMAAVLKMPLVGYYVDMVESVGRRGMSVEIVEEVTDGIEGRWSARLKVSHR